MNKTTISVRRASLALLACLGAAAPAQAQTVVLRGHLSPALAGAHWVSRAPVAQPLTLALSLPLRNEAQLADQIHRLYDPKDPQYGHFLTTQQFIDRYAPTEESYAAVIRYARSQGFAITETYPNRTLVTVQAPDGVVERSLGLQMHSFRAANGSLFRVANADPSVPAAIAAQISGIVGLDESAHWAPQSYLVPQAMAQALQPYQVGTGPGGALSPSDITKAYGLNNLTLANSATKLDGHGQVLGLFQLDGYDPSDIASFTSGYKLPGVPLQNVLVGGASGQPGVNAAEVTLDIELMTALAPGASKIMVYEAPNTAAGVIAAYSRIASDNIAKQVSTSWGITEPSCSIPIRTAENTAFRQMAAQGQTIFAASGDAGAFDNGKNLTVQDPASQPYITSVGGTQLFLNADGTYKKESTWSHGSIGSGAGGGGVSAVWSKPDWQAGVGVSAAARNVPDVALNSDPYTGYSVFYKGGWCIFGGTSCAAPLWAGFTALVNQQRAASGAGPVGFINPAIYKIGKNSRYTQDFYDIHDGSTNLFYPAFAGYDNATGWGSFKGAGLIADLAASSTTVATPVISLIGTPRPQVARTVALVAWGTNIASDSVLSYGPSPNSLSRSVANSSQVTAHQVTVNGLMRGVTYFYTVTSRAAGASVTSPVLSFVTAK
ncbi:pseudomonapepsin [Capsulimonas corticalis]|uniref:Pseudomonapepsin n=1 Tax=Capsulimonas corticalis TaxID=2219043 RepID=A0A402D1Z9_9BACT|nr:protease pro-enzyme activation domain-containing protein [Capsulimonas corticalis]BDI30119.1 pseudomonapepsin [Capsulimonas corticalis]